MRHSRSDYIVELIFMPDCISFLIILNKEIHYSEIFRSLVQVFRGPGSDKVKTL